MARSITRDEILADVKARFEYKVDFVPDADAVRMIDASIAQLYNLLTDADPDYYFTSDTISVVSGTDSYSIPTDFYKLHSVEYVNGDRIVPLKKFEWGERGRSSSPLYNATNTAPGLSRYRIKGENIYLTPNPTWSGTLNIHYIETPARLATGVATFDGIAGWEEHVILNVICMIAMKADEDVSEYKEAKAVMEAKIEAMAEERDFAEPGRIRNVDLEVDRDLEFILGR